MIEIFPCGTKVTIGGSIEATVTAVLIEDGRVSYKVSWWALNTNQRYEQWLAAHEIEPQATERVSIGFHNGRHL